MSRCVAVALFSLAVCCTHDESAGGPTVVAVTQVTPVTVVQQTTVQQTVPVHVQYGPSIDCDVICDSAQSSCDRACVPTSWSPNMQSIADSCEGDCDFNHFVCISRCVDSGGHSRRR
jgi:hypothetical protein